MKRTLTVFILAFLAIALPCKAQQLIGEVRLAGTLSQARMKPAILAMQSRPEMNGLLYQQMRAGEIISNFSSMGSATDRIDLALLPTPDSGVFLANEGHLRELPTGLNTDPGVHWRGEVISLFFDPSVIVIRKGLVPPSDEPQDRIELVRFLEKNATMLDGRVGLVNIGLDRQSYAYAAQDQLRSPIFWQLAQAFGRLNTRIYGSNSELVQAIGEGEIDLAYNVPLSEVSFADQENVLVILPKDYIISLPWVIVAPSKTDNPLLLNVLSALQLQVAQKRFPSKVFWQFFEDDKIPQTQQVKIGPELLVFLDPLKKNRILDTWFQMVTNQ
nr:hypothetical protein [uncultured Cohaesibacter sp.]